MPISEHLANESLSRRTADVVARRVASPRTQRAWTLLCERVQRIMELPLDYMPNAQFETWSRDKTVESEVLGPMPSRGEPPAGASAPSGLSPYMASLYEVPLLTREQEVHLFRKLNYLKYKANGLRERLNPARPHKRLLSRIETLCQKIIATRNQIICANLRLVVSIAKRQFRSAQNFFELVSDGNVTLMRAVERFDYAQGNKFSTYATWAIINTFARSVPECIRYHSRFRTDSLDRCTVTADVRSNEAELEAGQSHRQTTLDDVLRRLSNREREIIVCRFGLRHGEEPQTLQQLGDSMGVSKERIRQIEARALSKLREAVVPEMLPGPMDDGV